MSELKNINSKLQKLKQEISKVIVGQSKIVDFFILSLLSEGHLLLTGVPGLAKTLLSNTFSKALDLKFSRIQFTPDLMPADILGSEIIDIDPTQNRKEFRFIKGPIFSNFVLADEINRTPPRTQSALLESMQERTVHVAGNRYKLDKPFMVVATQNPLEQHGTYPLPEAQLDRFMFAVDIDYPTIDEEFGIVSGSVQRDLDSIGKIISVDEILKYSEFVKSIPVDETLLRYIIKFVRLTRPTKDNPLKEVSEYVSWGAGPRAGEFLLKAIKAITVLQGKFMTDFSDVDSVVYEVLNHRISLNFNAGVDKVSKKDILNIIRKYLQKNKI